MDTRTEVRHGGWLMKQTTAGDYWDRTLTPDDLEDAYVMRNGVLAEVWDCGVKMMGDKIVLYGNWREDMLVDPSEPIYYSPPERY